MQIKDKYRINKACSPSPTFMSTSRCGRTGGAEPWPAEPAAQVPALERLGQRRLANATVTKELEFDAVYWNVRGNQLSDAHLSSLLQDGKCTIYKEIFL